jgi:hypothetical protein
MPYSTDPNALAVLLDEVLADPGLTNAHEKTSGTDETYPTQGALQSGSSYWVTFHPWISAHRCSLRYRIKRRFASAAAPRLISCLGQSQQAESERRKLRG